jgi:hypothetical protein
MITYASLTADNWQTIYFSLHFARKRFWAPKVERISAELLENIACGDFDKMNLAPEDLGTLYSALDAIPRGHWLHGRASRLAKQMMAGVS